MQRAILGLTLTALLTAPLGAQTPSATVPPPPPPLCQVRASVYDSLPAFAPAALTARNVAAMTEASGKARSLFERLDAETAAVINRTTSGGDETLALVDLERVIDTTDKCGERLGWGPIMKASRQALYAALLRNRVTLVDPVYAARMLRSPTAQAVLKDNGQGAVIVQAAAVKAQQDKDIAAQRQRDREIAQAAYQRSETERKAREIEIRTGWRSNASAPPAGSNYCDSYGVIDYVGKAKDANWLGMMDYEAGTGCQRINNRRDGAFYMGLALGTEVTDEQLAHAAGNIFLCFSNSQNRKYFNQAMAASRSMSEMFGVEAMGAGLKPGWSDRTDARGRRIVRVTCDIQMSMLGMDLTGANKEFMDANGIDRRSFVEYELSGTRLMAVRYRSWIDNSVSSQTYDDPLTKNRSTTTICDGELAKADAIGRNWQKNQWSTAQSLPYSFTNPGGTQRSGKWMVLKRGTLTADIWNVSYDAPVLGEYGNCFGGLVEHYVTLSASRVSRIRAGVPPQF